MHLQNRNNFSSPGRSNRVFRFSLNSRRLSWGFHRFYYSKNPLEHFLLFIGKISKFFGRPRGEINLCTVKSKVRQDPVPTKKNKRRRGYYKKASRKIHFQCFFRMLSNFNSLKNNELKYRIRIKKTGVDEVITKSRLSLPHRDFL